MKDFLLKFKAKHSPYNDEVYYYDDCIVFKNGIIQDNDANYLLQMGEFDLAKFESVLDKHEIKSYLIELKDDKYVDKMIGYTLTDETSWFAIKDISKIKVRSVDSFEMIKVKTLKEFEIAKQISIEGFLTEDPTNPYEAYDDEGYCNILKRKIQTQKDEISRWFIFKNKSTGEHIAGVDLAIAANVCYVSGFTILPKYRGTKAFLVIYRILNYLKNEKVRTIFCTTKMGGYPERLYENLGFEKIFTIKQFTKNLISQNQNNQNF